MKITIFLLILTCNIARSSSEERSDKNEKEVVCFVYHRFGDNRFPSTNVAISDFKAHLDYLQAQGFQVLAFQEAIDYLSSTGPTKKTAVLTIDDGYKSFYNNGLPLLEEYGFAATLFINTETVGGSDYMSWAQLKDAQTRGIEIGNHTHSHAYFLNQPESERYINFEGELKLSQELIEKQLGTTPTSFAYPYGELDPKMESIVKKIGFTGAAAQNSGVIHAGSNLMRCPRFPMSEHYADPDQFKEKVNMRALKIMQEQPASFIKPTDTNAPQLELTLHNDRLRLGQINCFIQGGDCQISTRSKDKETTQIVIKPAAPITGRRRILYTLTVQDTVGQWHWYSHLWVNPKIK